MIVYYYVLFKKCNKKCRSPFLQEGLLRGREARHKAVSTKYVSCVLVLSIAISCPQVVVMVACEQAPKWGLGRKEKSASRVSRARSGGENGDGDGND